MSRRIDILGGVRNIIGDVFGVLGWLLQFARLMLVPKTVLAAELLAAESQPVACADAVDRRKAPKPRFTLAFRVIHLIVDNYVMHRSKIAARAVAVFGGRIKPHFPPP